MSWAIPQCTQTDRQTDGRTDGRTVATHSVLSVAGMILADSDCSYRMVVWVEPWRDGTQPVIESSLYLTECSHRYRHRYWQVHLDRHLGISRYIQPTGLQVRLLSLSVCLSVCLCKCLLLCLFFSFHMRMSACCYFLNLLMKLYFISLWACSLWPLGHLCWLTSLSVSQLMFIPFCLFVIFRRHRAWFGNAYIAWDRSAPTFWTKKENGQNSANFQWILNTDFITQLRLG